MKRIFSFILFLTISLNVFGYTDWDKDNVTGSSSPSDLDTLLQANNGALDDFLEYGRFQAKIVPNTVSSFYVGAGSVACSNSTGTERRLRKNTSVTTVTWADIDTGAEAVSTVYFVWAVADADASTFTVKISVNGTAPTGCTYYQRLGYFYNNPSGDIVDIFNFSNSVTVSQGTVYDGATIPLPTGALAASSYWIVSPYDTATNMNIVDGGASTYTGIKCYTDTSRVVTCKARNANTGVEGSIYANYILISVNQY